MNNFADAEQIILLGIAIAIGLLIGIERGWKFREAKEGERIAGLRTHGLIGLLGGVSGLLAQYLGVAAFGVVFLGFTVAVIIAYTVQWRTSGDISITSLIAMLLTFVLGTLVTLGHVGISASIAVIMAILLRFKDVLHGWLRKLGQKELHAVLQLLLISVVLLPVLPDRGYGPWQALNPYEIWWMVVLISGISFVGYFTMKIAGPGKGVILTALAAGMASSTALTLHFSHLYQKQPQMKNLLAAGILLACGTMFPRVVLVASLVNPALFNVLLAPMLVMTVLTLFSAAVIWRKKDDLAAGEVSDLINPLELKPALFFGLLLVVVILLGKAAVHYFGEKGILVLAFVSGIADVDPINLTLARMSISELTVDIVVLAIVIASSSNTLVKAGLAVFVGGFGLGVRVFVPLLMTAGSGLLTAWMM
ncbi:MAG TPA: MgtC/SapB family protein [Gammaproteobacteria bacterium]|nr:MgtC/SapB family protein [Gammaproteobacteria bacterium]